MFSFGQLSVATMFAAAGALCFLSDTTSAAIVVTPGSASIPQGTTSVVIPIMVSGGDPIDSITFDVWIGDGGPIAGGFDVVPITVFSDAFSIFKSTSSGSISTTDSLPSSSAVLVNGIVTEENASVTANGELFRITLDTSALTEGQQFPISIVGLGAALNNITVESSSTGGQLIVTAVPEPALVGGLFAAGLLTRRSQMKFGTR